MRSNSPFKVGITNQGDPGLDFSWVDHLDVVKFAVVVSKAANEKFSDILLENKKKLIYHAVCTGLAGTPIESNVPTVTEKFTHLKKLIDFGFPAEQIVVRIDPLFPAQWIDVINKAFGIDYLEKLKNILMMSENLGIRRIRYSYLNLYDFVLYKLQQISSGFVIDRHWHPIYEYEIQLDKINPNFEFEACAEYYVPPHHIIPCISDKDLRIMKLKFGNKLTFPNPLMNSPMCSCPVNKLELMIKKFDCSYDCKYCYWKQEKVDYISLKYK